jgi:rhodanese-related sulfurtransferase/DNA-binding transcriptional ArsR family regulator
MRSIASLKKVVYEQLSRIGKAIASPPRLELLDLLCQGPRTVEALARETALSLANCSQHLRVLHRARLVATEKQGLYVTYRLADLAVCEFFRSLRILGEQRLAEIELLLKQFREEREVLEPVAIRALLRRIRRGEVTVLDVRPPEEYRAGHVPGAVSIPLKDLKSHLSSLARDQEIVAYCRGPYCVLAKEAVRLLRAKGFSARRMECGIPDWRALGLPVVIEKRATPGVGALKS